MHSKAWYPEDYLTILENTLTSDEITHHLSTPNTASRFLYGALMLPTVLKYFLHADETCSISQRMTPALLRGYKLHQFSTSSTPVIVPAAEPTAVVEGILVLGLDDAQRNSIYEVEGGLMHLVGVEVQVYERQRADAYEMRCARLVDTGTFVWKGSREGLAPLSGASWCLDGFLTGQFYRHIVQSQQRDALDRMSEPGGGSTIGMHS